MKSSAPSRPLVRYHGGKWRIAPWVIKHFPKHHLYVEPFGGGASVLLQKSPCRTEIYNDLDDEIFGLFKVLRDPISAKQLSDLVAKTVFSRTEYNGAYETSTNPVEQARRTLIKSFMGMGSKGIYVKSGFDARVNDDGFLSRKNAFVALPDVLSAAAARLREVVLENGDGIEICKRYIDHPNSLIYVDPPYVFDSYAGSHIYRCRMTDDDHRKLGETLNAASCAVIVSGYHSKLYNEIFADWTRVEIPAMADGGKKRTEVLWLKNVPIKSPELSF